MLTVPWEPEGLTGALSSQGGQRGRPGLQGSLSKARSRTVRGVLGDIPPAHAHRLPYAGSSKAPARVT